MNVIPHILFTSLFSIIVLFLLAKLMGNRQVSQMSMFDYVNGITIGSIAAEFATSLEDDYWMPLTAMVVYGVTAALISYITCKSMAARKFINGKPVVLYENGKLYEKNLAAAKLDINEFLTQCRTAGYFDLADLQTAILETNGQVSFLPLAAQRPVTPEDLQMTPDPERPCVNVILDGTVIPKNLKYTGNDDVWLKKQLEAQHVTRIGDVFLATVNAQNELAVYPRTAWRTRCLSKQYAPSIRVIPFYRLYCCFPHHIACLSNWDIPLLRKRRKTGGRIFCRLFC